MARDTGPVCKQCRREGVKLFLKGDRCFTDKCAYDRRPYAPGQHGQRRAKFSEYARHLREKQKARRMYGVLEKQFLRYFEMAEAQKGVTGDNLFGLLERRLDNVVYRMGFAPTRRAARQMVVHNHVLVDGKRVNRPSFLVKPGSQVSIRERSKKIATIAASLEAKGRQGFDPWVDVDVAKFSGVLREVPSMEELQLPIDAQLIVEYYSR